MSGSSFNKTWSLISRNNQAERLAKQLGWKGQPGNEKEMLEFLEGVSAFEIDDASKLLLNDEEIFGFGCIIPFGPVIEPYETDNCLVSKDPVEMARETWSNDIDLIVIGTSFEGILRAFANEESAASVLQNPSFFAPLTELRLSANDEKSVEYGTRIKRLFYEEDEEPSVENQEQYLHFSSYLHVWHGLYRVIQSRSMYAKGNTFLMRFDADGELNIFKKFVKKCEKYKGASHADDLFYLFSTTYNASPPKSSLEFSTIQKFIGMFTSFAITGNPNCNEVEHLAIKPNDGSEPLMCVNITLNEVAEIELPEAKKLKVWNSIYDEENVPLI
jgi:cholinesterase